jgi:hypothetical protein
MSTSTSMLKRTKSQRNVHSIRGSSYINRSTDVSSRVVRSNSVDNAVIPPPCQAEIIDSLEREEDY